MNTPYRSESVLWIETTASPQPRLQRLRQRLAAVLCAGLLASCGSTDSLTSVRDDLVRATADTTATPVDVVEAASKRNNDKAARPVDSTTTTTSSSTSGTSSTTGTTSTTTTTSPTSTTSTSTSTSTGTTSTSTSTGTTSTSTTTTATPINTVDTIVNDMKLRNDVRLAGITYSYADNTGFVIMGNNPRGTGTPSWWNPSNTYFKSDAWWQVLLPWMVIFDGEGNAATNTRVEMRDLKVYLKSRSTGQWSQLAAGRIDGANYPKSLQGSTVAAPNIRTESTTSISVKPPNGDAVFHGWCCGKRSINGPDVAAVFVTMQARLVVDSTALADDRSAAKYLIQVGGDYYPTATTSISEFAPDYYNPGIGLSRSKLVSNQWQSFSFTTLAVGVQDPGGQAISEAELRAAPPPLE